MFDIIYFSIIPSLYFSSDSQLMTELLRVTEHGLERVAMVCAHYQFGEVPFKSCFPQAFMSLKFRTSHPLVPIRPKQLLEKFIWLDSY